MYAGFHAEGTADIAGDDTNIGRGDFEIVLRHAVTQIERRLMRRMHDHPPIRPKLGPNAARLHGVCGAAGYREVQLRDMRGGFQIGFGRLGIAALP